jgi:2,3-bisphosphoglycerate-dependent phosphoglycerate mutase
MQLYLIRHAESDNNARPVQQRSEDPAITALGDRQAEHLANWTRTLTIDTLITSPFRRAIETTRHILKATPQHVHVWHDVYERGGCFRGHLPDQCEGAMGMGRTQIIAHLDRAPETCTIDATIDDSGWWGGQDRETDEQAAVRASTFLTRLENTFANNGETIVVVTHADFKRLVLSSMLSGVLDPTSLGPLRNTGITKVDFDGRRWQLDWLNSVSHLPAKLITGHTATFGARQDL